MRRDLKPGSFYWVCPVFDVDFTPPGFDHADWSDEMAAAATEHWTQNEQPARFNGYSEHGEEQWTYLGQDEDPPHWWPVCWVGEEIVQPKPKP